MIYNIRVPNLISSTAKILVIGESPGEDEELQGKPFIGQAGQFLNTTLFNNGLTRADISFTNLSQFRPQGNKFFHLYGSQELRIGESEVTQLIKSGQYNIVVPLGKEALKFVTGKQNIHTWRGSIIESILKPKQKVVATFHPAFILRSQENIPAFDLDWARIANESKFPDFRFTNREFVINPQGMELETWVEKLCKEELLSIDIETTYNNEEIICIGFSPNPNLSITIFLDNQHSRSCAQKILSSKVKKIFHFGTFDRLALLEHKFEIEGPFEDTYVAQLVLNAGQPNTLAYLTSIYTTEAYYKAEGRAEIPEDTKVWASTTDKKNLGIYNCKDCCVTREIFPQQKVELCSESLYEVYRNRMRQVEMAINISRAGFNVDIARRDLLRKALYNNWMKKQWALDMLCKNYIEKKKKTVNVNSPFLKGLLYGAAPKGLALPERKKRDKNGKWVTTTDDNALVQTIAYVKGKIEEIKDEKKKHDYELRLAIVQLIHKIRGIRKLLSSYIEVKISNDGRIRSMFKLGPLTGRWAANKYVDKTGVNAQTFYRGYIDIPDDVEDSIINIDALFKTLDLEKEQDQGSELTEDVLDSITINE